jgi:hypothetical protein
MKIGDRIPALIRTLQSITAWATLLEPSGVSVRFLNYSGDMNDKFDKLSSQEKIANIVYNVKLGRYTRLGTALQEKILEHRAGRSKPLIAVIITDGEVRTFLQRLALLLSSDAPRSPKEKTKTACGRTLLTAKLD